MSAPRPSLLVAALALACGSSSGAGDATTTGSTGTAASSSDATGADASGTSDTSATGSSTGAADGSTSTSGTTGDPDACWTDLGFGEHAVFYDGFTGGSEGMAFGTDGKLYATTNEMPSGLVWQLDGDGTATQFATVPFALGLAPRPDGGFVVASIGVTMQADGAVYRVEPDGSASVWATGIADPNFVTMLPDGTALVSDDFDTRIFHVAADGTVTVALEMIESPNGMAYSPDRTRLYVATTFADDPPVTAFDVDDQGLPIAGTGVEILRLGMASTPDGLAVDVDDMVYVAANIKGEIWRVAGSSTEVVPGELVASGLGTPASLAFGRGPDFDPCSLYVTQLFGAQILRVAVGAPGVPVP